MSDNNTERQIPQTGETYFMPMHTSYCRIDAHDKKSKRTLIKWLDKHDEYNKPHKVFYIDRYNKDICSSANTLYITDIGEVTEGDYLYTDPIAGCGIEVGIWKLFPRKIVDEIDPDCIWRYAGEKWLDVAKKVSAKIEADTKIENEFLEKEQKRMKV